VHQLVDRDAAYVDALMHRFAPFTVYGMDRDLAEEQYSNKMASIGEQYQDPLAYALAGGEPC
jgi:hypothetical protein